MKIMAFGDIHFHHTHRFSHITPDGFSTRELEQLSCADRLIELYRKEKIDKVVFLGDMWGPVGDSMSCQTLYAITEFLKRLTAEFEMDIIIGNHDVAGQVNNQYSNKLAPFVGWNRLHIYDKPTVVGDFVYMPYCLNDEQADSFLKKIENKDKKYIFSHLEIANIDLGNNVFTKRGIDIELLKQFKMTFQGHFHRGGSYGQNIQIAGSTQRLSFKDPGRSRKNILIYDTDTQQLKRDSFTCPDWLTFTDENIEDVLNIDNNNYVKVDVSTDILITPEIKRKLEMVKGLDMHIDISRIAVNRKVQDELNEETELDVLKKFVCDSDNDDKTKEDLIQEGHRLIDTVMDK